MRRLNDLYIPRLLDLRRAVEKKSAFLFGPRQTGKSSLIAHQFSDCKVYDLLDSPTLLSLSHSPERLSQEIEPHDQIVVIDEIQKLPSLLNEVHRLIETKKINFLLTGSSARKLRRGGANLLGGRARSYYFHPLTYNELQEKFNLEQALNHGLIPSIYFSDSAEDDLASYAGDYLKEEIAAEGLTRNIPAFSRFLEVAALCNGKLINYTEIANDAQVPRTTIYEYFDILKDTLIAYDLPAWKKSKTRKPISSSKLYFFDVGVVTHLQHRGELKPRSPEFGDALETYIFHELKTFIDHSKSQPLSYWRSTSGFEVDFLMGDEVAIEVKGKENISNRDLRGLKALQDEKTFKHYILVSLEKRRRMVNNINIIPWEIFLKELWQRKWI